MLVSLPLWLTKGTFHSTEGRAHRDKGARQKKHAKDGDRPHHVSVMPCAGGHFEVDCGYFLVDKGIVPADLVKLLFVF
jgi:hypothetical protein